jgi:6-phosphogluconolactonase (cycloisomerase 2 family)
MPPPDQAKHSGRMGVVSQVRATRLVGVGLMSLAFLGLTPGGASGSAGRLSYEGCLTDPDSGTYPACDQSEGLETPSQVVVSPDGGSVYVAAGNDAISGVQGALTVFRRDRSSGALAFVDCYESSEPPDDACTDLDLPLFEDLSRLAISPDGRNLYVSGAAGGIFSFNRRADTGELTFGQCVFYLPQHEPPPPPCVSGAREDTIVDLEISPDGRSLYASGYVCEQYASSDCYGYVDVYRRNRVNGDLDSLRYLETRLDTASLAIAPDGRSLYLAERGRIERVPRSRKTGKLTRKRRECLAAVSRRGDRIKGCRFIPRMGEPQNIALSRDGRSLVVTTDAGVSVLRTSKRRRVTLAGCIREARGKSQPGCPVVGGVGLDVAHAPTMSPDGRSVYLAGGDTDLSALLRLTYAKRKGRLRFGQCFGSSETELRRCRLIPELIGFGSAPALSKDGQSLYAGAWYCCTTAGGALLRFAVPDSH